MVTLKRVLVVGVVLAAVWAVGRLFISELGAGRGVEGPPAIVLAPPPGVPVTDLGDASRAEAARRLSELSASGDSGSPAAVHFFPGDGRELYWFVEDGGGEEPALVERRSGPGGTRVETRWRGSVEERLAWAQVHDNLEAPQLPEGESHNLYH